MPDSAKQLLAVNQIMSTIETGGKSRVSPFYLVLDLSGSMRPYLDTLQAAAEFTVTYLTKNIYESSVCRLSLIGFGSEAKTLIPLCDLARSRTPLPVLQDMGGTEYHASFQELVARINDDMPVLLKDYFVTRPCILFLTDGSPTDRTDDWMTARQQLIETRYRPNILSFGFGSVQEDTLKAVATINKEGQLYAYIHDGKTRLDDMLPKLFFELTQSIVTSSVNASLNQPQEPFKTPAGFVNLELDVIDPI